MAAWMPEFSRGFLSGRHASSMGWMSQALAHHSCASGGDELLVGAKRSREEAGERSPRGEASPEASREASSSRSTLLEADAAALQRCVAEAQARRHALQADHLALRAERADRATREAQHEERFMLGAEQRRRFLKSAWQQEEASAWLASERLCAEARQQRGDEAAQTWRRVEGAWREANAKRAVYASFVAWMHAEQAAWRACEAPLATAQADAHAADALAFAARGRAWREVELAWGEAQRLRGAHYAVLVRGAEGITIQQ